MLAELKARILFNWYCLVMVDGSWDMGAVLWGSLWPLGGVWINERGVYKRLADAVSQRA